MDSNKSRAAKRQLVLYLNPDEAEQLTSVAKQLGQTKNSVVRTALSDYLRRLKLTPAERAPRRSAGRRAGSAGRPGPGRG
jgi:hypothetical protein